MAHGNTTNGRPSVRPDGSLEPYALSTLQRTIVMTIHQERRPLGVEDFVLRMGRGRGDSTLRAKLKRCFDETLVPNGFAIIEPHPERADEVAYGLTRRAVDIAINIVAASVG